MHTKYDDALLHLGESLKTVTEMEIENKAGLIAIQMAFLALSSQLTAQGLVQPDLIAAKMMAAVDEIKGSLDRSSTIIEEFAAQIAALSAPATPHPPVGRLRLFSPDE